MKKFFGFLAIYLTFFAMSAVAQNLQEVVYLKNGSIIKGVVIEQVPGVSLKIKTSDGSIFAYQMSDVEKITKEEITSRNNTARSTSSNSISYPHYKGFVDLGYTFGVGLGNGVDRIDLFTSHGVQLFPQLYVGAGAGLNYVYCPGYSEAGNGFVVPLFANVRTDILDSWITPFIDLKIGYSIVDANGFFLSPTIGCRIKRYNIGVGYVMQRDTIEDFYDKYSVNVGGISIKIGINF